jgi:AAA15 family ATPase/GTPase
MLIEFSVENYRSVKERQTLSMVVGEGQGFSTGFPSAPYAASKTAIYGPNASGKTNLIMALKFLQKWVVESTPKHQPDDPIEDVVPYLFSTKTQKKPSTFEIVFIHAGYLFQYGFTADDKNIHAEWLYATPQDSERKKPQEWYRRDETDAKKSIVKKELKGAKEDWKKETRHNALFLSTAANRNSEDFRKPFEWIKNYLRPVKGYFATDFTLKQIEAGKKQTILKFMKALDFSFDDIKFTETKVDTPADLRAWISSQPGQTIPEHVTQVDVFTTHPVEEGGHIALNILDESDGTRRLVAFAGPILDVLENGYTMVVDEINARLHPLALKGVVSMFSNKRLNKKNAQLIFTTHDTSLMNSLKVEEIWLMDKGKFGDTTLTALSEFKGDHTSIEKRYLAGRYGGLPNMSDLG